MRLVHSLRNLRHIMLFLGFHWSLHTIWLWVYPSLKTQLSSVPILCGSNFHYQLPPKFFIPTPIISFFNQNLFFVPLCSYHSHGHFFWLTDTKFVTLYDFCSCHFLHHSRKLMYLGQSWGNLYLLFSCLPKVSSSVSHIEMSYAHNKIFENSSPAHKTDQLQDTD